MPLLDLICSLRFFLLTSLGAPLICNFPVEAGEFVVSLLVRVPLDCAVAMTFLGLCLLRVKTEQAVVEESR